jgi:predicted nucleotidyltransferase
MLNTRIALKQIHGFLADLKTEKNISVEKAVLFGSVAKGTSRTDSDIDLAIWSEKFEGCVPFDLEKFSSVKAKYPLIEVHTFQKDEDKYSNPFIEEIERYGILVN